MLQFVRYIAGNTIGIIWNCIAQESIRPYHYSVLWVKLLEPWMRSSYPEIRLQCKFIAGHLSSVCAAAVPSNSSCLELDKEDIEMLFSLLASTVNSSNFITQQFDWEFSAIDLVLGYSCISSNLKNFSRIINPELMSLLVVLLQKAETVTKIEVCKLLWKCVESSISFQVEDSLALNLVKDLENTEDFNLKVLSVSVRVASLLKSSFDVEIGEFFN